MRIEQVDTNAQLDNLNNPSSGVDYGELILPTAFTDAMSLEQQIFWLLVHKEDRLRAGDNITLVKNQDGTVTISSTGGSGSGSTYRIDSVEPDTGYAAAYALIDISTGEQSGETIQIPEAGQGPQGDPGVGISSIVGVVGDTGTTVTVTLTDDSTQTFFVQRGVAGQDGQDGAPGQPGQDGTDGVSPEVTITSITGGHRVTITDADHPLGQSFDIMDGEDGQDGAPGQPGQPGQDGVTPNISASATVGTSVGTPTVQVTKSGTTAAPEFTFAFDGLKGSQGSPGQNGQDGISPTVTVRTITGGHQIEIVSAGGTERFDVMDGTDGTDGTDGISPTVTVRSITGGHQIEIVSAGGTERFDVMDGTDGSAATIQVGTVTTGQPGTNASVTNSGTSSAAVLDFTIPAGATGSQGPAGPGVPNGGSTGQVLTKLSNSDQDTGWSTPSSGGGVSVVEKSILNGSMSPTFFIHGITPAGATDTQYSANVDLGEGYFKIRELLSGNTAFDYDMRGAYIDEVVSATQKWRIPVFGKFAVTVSDVPNQEMDFRLRSELHFQQVSDSDTVSLIERMTEAGFPMSGKLMIGFANANTTTPRSNYGRSRGAGTWQIIPTYVNDSVTYLSLIIAGTFKADLYHAPVVIVYLI